MAKKTESSPAGAGRYIRMKELRSRLGVGTTTCYRMLRDGDIPPGVRLSAGVVVWPESVVEDLVRARQRDPLPQGRRGGDLRSPEARTAKGLQPLQAGRRAPAPAPAPAPTKAKRARSSSASA